MLKDLQSPVGEIRSFVWCAEYEDGTHLAEFDHKLQETKFSEIQKDKVERFGIFGRGVKLSFSTKDGIFDIANKKVEIYIQEDNGNRINITGRLDVDYKDIITFKHFYQDHDALSGRPVGGLITDMFFFGYKNTFIDQGRTIHAKVIFNLPFGTIMKFGYRFVCKDRIKGKLVVLNDGLIVDKVDIEIGEDGIELETDFVF